MPQFTTLQQHAKQLHQTFMGCFAKDQGCLTFFSPTMPTAEAVSDSALISCLAESLDSDYDDALISYFQDTKKNVLITAEEYLEFKRNILVGIYLLKWSKYTLTLFSTNNSLIELFQADLAVKSPAELDKDYVDTCLNALSKYCSFVYASTKDTVYSNLNKQLGIAIQAEIHLALHGEEEHDSPWYMVLSGAMYTLGIKQ